MLRQVIVLLLLVAASSAGKKKNNNWNPYYVRMNLNLFIESNKLSPRSYITGTKYDLKCNLVVAYAKIIRWVCFQDFTGMKPSYMFDSNRTVI